MAYRRGLTTGERALAASVFGDAIDYDAVRIVLGRWAFFQPRDTVMAPMGHIHFNPRGSLFREDFAAEPIGLQGLFIHEMTHVWQAQTRGRWWLPLMRHPFCRYGYDFTPGKPLARYGIEQQAEVVRHAFLMQRGCWTPKDTTPEQMRAVLPFCPAVGAGTLAGARRA